MRPLFAYNNAILDLATIRRAAQKTNTHYSLARSVAPNTHHYSLARRAAPNAHLYSLARRAAPNAPQSCAYSLIKIGDPSFSSNVLTNP